MSAETASECSVEPPEFRSWRRYLWPVHHYELKKLIPMLLIFFFISFDYNLLRTLKDSLLVTAKSSGAEVIPFIKVWGVFPGAVLMTLIFAWLSNRLSRETVFYVMIAIFLSYFTVFTFVLYPIRDFIHPHALADRLELTLPLGCKGLVAMFRYWTFSIFYVMSELWSSAIFSVLLWGFANQITKVNEAKRFYGLFGVGGNLSGFFAGQLSVYCCNYTRQGRMLLIGEDPWHQSLILITSMILVAGLLSLILFYWFNSRVLTDSRFYEPSSVAMEKQTRTTKLSFKESVAYLLRSPYLMQIALVVISYNLVINLTEVLWKHLAKELYPDPNDYTIYMNQVISLIAIVATLSSWFVSGSLIRKFGWTFTALLTPFILSLTSIGFFSCFFIKQNLPHWNLLFMGLTPLALVVLLGSTQNILSRGAKYSIFDATKEMAFIPLPVDSQLIGKAAIDGVVSRLGKSGGSIIHQGLILFFGTISFSAPYVALTLFFVIIGWVLAVRLLGQQFNSLIMKTEPIASPSLVSSSSLPSRSEGLASPHLVKEPQAI
jgi:ATP:ADP antiporter, AAA family